MRISDWSSDVCSSDLEIVGILPVGRRSEAQALPGLHDGKRTHGSAYSSLPAGIVAIEAHRRHVDELPRKKELVLGERGAVRRDRGVESDTVETDDVHIAFDDEEAPLGADRKSTRLNSELQSLKRTSYAVFCLKKKKL